MKNQIEFLESIRHGSEAFPVMVYYNGGFTPHHWHPEYELIYMLSGNATYYINTDIVSLSEGDCCICKGGQLHSMILNDGEQVQFHAIVFDLKFILKDIDICNQFFSGEYLINCKFSAFNKKEKTITDSIKEICEVFQAKRLGYELEVKMLLIKIFADILKYGFYSQVTEVSQESKMQKTLMRVIHYIQTFYQEKISLETLADLTGYSVSHFGRFFKESIGQTPAEYIISYRLYKACELLRSSDKSVLEIALDCGFFNVTYFIKTFKKKYGCTPYKYKKQH